MPVDPLLELLERVYPFRFLHGDDRSILKDVARERAFAPSETIIRRGEEEQSVFLIAQGVVEVFDPSRGRDELVTTIYADHYFGEWEAIFDEPRVFSIRARTECRCWEIPAEPFRELLARSPSFALGFGTILRDNQGIFAAFERFRVHLLQEADRGHIGIGRLLPLYRELQPALHPGAVDDRRIDVSGLLYAVRRLPDNVTRTFAFLLMDELPASMHEPDRLFPTVRTGARRRDVWEVLPGKDLIVLRTGDSDLIDLVTCLCLYAVEARKIRERLMQEDSLESLARFSRNHASVEGTPTDRAAIRNFLLTLPFSSREVDGFMSIWPDDPVGRISDIARHREMFSIDVRRREQSYNVRRDELWISRVAQLTRDLVGYDPPLLPSNRAIHIVSSNTHSVTNCLNPWYVENADRVLQWGTEQGHPATQGAWDNSQDQVYAIARDFFLAHREDAATAARIAESVGHARLDATASTGIQVQLIDLSRLGGAGIDPLVIGNKNAIGDCDDIIVNIDYAFGRQAQYVIRNLLMLYGERVRSVSFFGKAGALLGERGDLLVPTAFVEQQSDLFYPIPHRDDSEILARRLPSRSIHSGPMLTVDGTLLQNREMLNFYRRIWGVVGMEMEGTHYYRQILEARELGVIPRDLRFQFCYYVSDLPMRPAGGALLSAPLALSEGVPPLYAITRHILASILGGWCRERVA